MVYIVMLGSLPIKCYVSLRLAQKYIDTHCKDCRIEVLKLERSVSETDNN